jgi:hypothetical protein
MKKFSLKEISLYEDEDDYDEKWCPMRMKLNETNQNKTTPNVNQIKKKMEKNLFKNKKTCYELWLLLQWGAL